MSAVLELEITEGMFGGLFDDEKQTKLAAQIEEFRSLTAKEIALKLKIRSCCNKLKVASHAHCNLFFMRPLSANVARQRDRMPPESL